jgi:hypothetical protein
MTNLYNWEKTYLSAVYETEDAKMAGRILEAQSAMEQRLLSPIGDEERLALERAMEGLTMLRAERASRNPDHASRNGNGPV